jgi:hypothetical protein
MGREIILDRNAAVNVSRVPGGVEVAFRIPGAGGRLILRAPCESARSLGEALIALSELPESAAEGRAQA